MKNRKIGDALLDRIWGKLGVALAIGLASGIGGTRFYQKHAERELYALGIASMQKGQTTNAETAFKQALTLDSSHLWARFGLAWAQQKLGRLAESKQNYLITLQQSKDMQGYSAFNLGIVAKQEGRFAESIQYFRTAMEVPRFHSDSLENLKQVYRQQIIGFRKVGQTNKANEAEKALRELEAPSSR